MKKKLVTLFLGASLALAVSACGAKPAAGDNANAEAAAGSSESTETAAQTDAASDSTAETTETGAANEQAQAEQQDNASNSDDSTVSANAGSYDDAPLKGTLKLGSIGPLTGAAAIYGNAVNNASQIAADEINAKSSDFTIEYRGEDDEHDSEKSVNAYNNLKDWNVQAIVGSVTTTPCIAVATEAYSDRMFMLTPSASSTQVTENNDNVFQLCFSDPNQGSASAKYIKDHAIGENIAVIYNNSDAYSTGIYQKFQEEADALGLSVVSVTTFTDDTANDFSVQLKSAQDAGADLLFLPIYYTPASLILQQAESTGYDVKVFGVDGMDGILTLEGFDTALAEGVMLLTPFSADATDELTSSFVSKYKETYADTPSQFAADGYDSVYAIYDALKYYAANNGELDVTNMSYSELCDILISVFSDPGFTVNGITGDGMTWSAEGEVNKEPKAVVIQNGTYVGL